MDKPANTDLPIHPLIRGRYSPRAFADKAVAAGDVTLLLEAARWAASCFNDQPWRFLVATRERPEGHAKMLGCLVESNQRWASAAPVLLLCVAARNFERSGKANAHARHDLGLAMGNLSLQAGALGLSLHIMAGIDREAARAAYGIPEDFDVVTGVAVGYAGAPDSLPAELAERERAPRSRKPLEELVFADAWGEPRRA
ncbi:MAG: nitroreductase family protein [Myxococcales bacterium]|nr:nitroreductase family protein [Myxococcales bacterium]